MEVDVELRAEIKKIARDVLDVSLSAIQRRAITVLLPTILLAGGWLVTLEVRTRDKRVSVTSMESLRKKIDDHKHPEIVRVEAALSTIQGAVAKEREMLGRIDERVLTLKEDLSEIRNLILAGYTGPSRVHGESP